MTQQLLRCRHCSVSVMIPAAIYLLLPAAALLAYLLHSAMPREIRVTPVRLMANMLLFGLSTRRNVPANTASAIAMPRQHFHCHIHPLYLISLFYAGSTACVRRCAAAVVLGLVIF